jgi:hypothetical protein
LPSFKKFKGAAKKPAATHNLDWIASPLEDPWSTKIFGCQQKPIFFKNKLKGLHTAFISCQKEFSGIHHHGTAQVFKNPDSSVQPVEDFAACLKG